MSWLQLRIKTSKADVEALEDALLESGALSVTLEDSADEPILEPGVGQTPLWDSLRVTGLYPSNTDTPQVIALLAAHFTLTADQWHWDILENQAWETLWMEHYHPIQCGEHLWICPSWCEPPDANAVNLSLDPGLAFGSGTHATTFLCLQWLDSQDLRGKTVIDFGCGSGILGIAALLLGAKHVIAVDNDPQALTSTRTNATRNNLSEAQITTYLPDQVPPGSADLVIANILAAPLIELADQLTGLTVAGGKLCMSGMIIAQIQTVMPCYTEHFTFAEALTQEDWVCLTAEKAVEKAVEKTTDDAA